MEQGYVSDLLTHFVGRGRPEGEQYALLVEILRTGRLAHPPHAPSRPQRLVVDLDEPLETNRMVRPPVVCFADIPARDLGLHMRKYGRFGVAFRKETLLARGANPVFYVARDAPVPARRAGVDVERLRREVAEGRFVWDDADVAPVARGEHLDAMVRGFFEAFDGLLAADAADLRAARADGREDDALEAARRLRRRVDVVEAFGQAVLAYVKVFEDARPDGSRDNWYMEREWRVVGDVRFALDDVARVVLPRAYEARFRADVPAYEGELRVV